MVVGELEMKQKIIHTYYFLKRFFVNRFSRQRKSVDFIYEDD